MSLFCFLCAADLLKTGVVFFLSINDVSQSVDGLLKVLQRFQVGQRHHLRLLNLISVKKAKQIQPERLL